MKKHETDEEKLRYREPMRVQEVILYYGEYLFPVCPRCNNSFEIEYQSFCDRCGQKLSWKGFSRIKVKRIVY